MLKIFGIFVFATLLLGCYNTDDPFILDHTNSIVTFSEPDGYSVDVYLEDREDLERTSVTVEALLDAQRIVYDQALVIKPMPDLQSVTLFVPHELDTWFHILRPVSGTSLNNTTTAYYTHYTDIDAFYVMIKPTIWVTRPRNSIMHFYIHELTHHVEHEALGSLSSSDHENTSYWGAGGFCDVAKKKWDAFARDN